MLNSRSAAFIVILSVSINSALARNHAVIVGGSCDQVAENRNFIDPTTNWTNVLKAKNYRLDVYYDGLTGKKLLVENKYPLLLSEIKDFTWENFLKSLDPKNFTNGDKLFLKIAAHGSPEPHGICTEDGKFHPISEIKSALEKLVNEKHVKIGILDNSCYAGNSIDNLNIPGVCVVSLAGRLHKGTGDFVKYVSQLIAENMIADINGDGEISLEELFLSAKKNNRFSLNFPSITGDPRDNVIYEQKAFNSPYGSGKELPGESLNRFYSEKNLAPAQCQNDIVSSELPGNIKAKLSAIGYTEEQIKAGLAFLKSNRPYPLLYEEPAATTINYLLKFYGKNNQTESNPCAEFKI